MNFAVDLMNSAKDLMNFAAAFGVLFGIALAALLVWALGKAGWPERLARFPAVIIVGVHLVAAFLKPPLLWIYLLVVVGIYAGFFAWFVERARVNFARWRLGVYRFVGTRSVPVVLKAPSEVSELPSERKVAG